MGRQIALLLGLIWLTVVGIILIPIQVLSQLILRVFLRKQMNDEIAWDLLASTQGYREKLDNLVSLPSNSPKKKREQREFILLSSGRILCADILKYEPLCGKELRSILNEMRQIESIVKEKINDGVRPDEVLLKKFEGLVEESGKYLRPMTY